MRGARILLLVAATLPIGFAGRATAQAPQQQGAQVGWAESWEAAVGEARARNCPIFITFHQDH